MYLYVLVCVFCENFRVFEKNFHEGPRRLLEIRIISNNSGCGIVWRFQADGSIALGLQPEGK